MRSVKLILGALLLGACGGPLPNGKEGVLSFQASPDVIRSADYAVLIRHSWSGSNGALGLEATYDYDFTGTQVETTTTGGLSVVSTGFDRMSDRDLRIRLRCGGEHGKKEQLRVRIHSGWQTHYEDAFDITCWEPNEVTFESTGPWISQATFYGKMKAAFIGEQGRVDLSRQGLDTYYIELPDPEGRLGYAERRGPDQQQNLGQLIFETKTPGSNAELLLGERRILLPVEVLADEAWNLRVELVSSGEQRHPNPGKAHTLQGSAVLPNGSTVRQLDDCRWKVQSGEADIPTYAGCYVTAVTHGRPAVVCAQTRGKETCLNLSP